MSYEMKKYIPIRWLHPDFGYTISATDIVDDKPAKFAVRHDGLCLSKDGHLKYEPAPSARGKNFANEFRFDTFESAAAALEQHRED